MLDPDACDDSDTPLPLLFDWLGCAWTNWSESGRKGDDGPGEKVEVELCDDAWALVLQLSGTSTVRDGCSVGNFLRISGIKMVG